MGTSLTARVGSFVAAHGLIPPGGAVTCMVSGGADSTCLWHVLRTLGFDVAALHVHHGVRGADADADARHCLEEMGAEIVRVPPASTEAACGSSATAFRRRVGSAPPVTRPRIRSRPCSTG